MRNTKMNDLDLYFNHCIRTAIHSTLTVRDKGLVPKDHRSEMAYWLSNGQVTDDVT